MREFEPDEMAPPASASEIMRSWFRVTAALFGMFLIVMGLYFANELFQLAYSAATEPDRFGPVVEKWTDFLGDDVPLVDVNNGQVTVEPRLFAFFALAAAGLVMLFVISSLITTGAKIVYWMGTDLDAVKRVLSSVFGPSVIKVVKEPNEARAKPFDHPNPQGR